MLNFKSFFSNSSSFHWKLICVVFSYTPLAFSVEDPVLPSAPPAALVQVVPNDPRVTPAFAALGPMVEASGLIWSGVVPKEMNHEDALTYCQGLGARLPTHEQWEALARAMGYELAQSRYNPDLMAGTRGQSFWSSSLYPDNPRFALNFHGSTGELVSSLLHFELSVRCVAAAEGV